MLEIKNLTKKYSAGDNEVLALNDVTLSFRKCEMVAILGQSGCGKTTLLNIIGGLDRASDGELFINGISTKKYLDKDWDKYRNNYIGFIFQSYNLIPHLTVLDNVAMALTLSGVGIKERREIATAALEKVGLGDVLNKKPNQLSGGQMQRVSIARALVNNPDIILADEPTGALDVNTGIQVMELLKEVAKDRLVVMVTHNHDLADEYATRIVKISDGQIIDDTNPYAPTEEEVAAAIIQTQATDNVISDAANVAENESDIYIDGEVKEDSSVKKKFKFKSLKANKKRKNNKENKVAMSLMTALKLSFQNLRTKKGRTIVTSIAGSIGIIGVALVLAISSGMSSYISDMQVSVLSSYPITVEATYFNINTTAMPNMNTDKGDMDNDKLYPFEPQNSMITDVHSNKINDEYLAYVSNLDTSLYTEILYSHSIYLPLLYKNSADNFEALTSFESSPMGNTNDVKFQQLPSVKFLEDQFELLGNTSLPSGINQIALVVDSKNQIDTSLLARLGITYESGKPLPFDQILGKEFSIAHMDDIFKKETDTKFSLVSPSKEIFDKGEKVKITSIIRAKNSSGSAMLGRGLAYTQELKTKMLDNAKMSEVALTQKENKKIDVTTGSNFNPNLPGIGGIMRPQPSYDSVMKRLGGDDTPSIINIYPKSFESKEKIKTYLNAYNNDKADKDKILCSDMTEMMTETMDVMINTITAVLIAIAAVSLVVSTIMIGIIIYVSVVERTKEIGVLRSIGARKLDISRVFSAEAIIIGAIAGVIGIALTYLLSIPINMIIFSMLGVSGICALPAYYAVGLIVLSMTLTLIGGLFPAYKASQKDIVNALRTE